MAATTNLSDADRAALELADVQWGADVLGMNDVSRQVAAELSDLTRPDEDYPYYSVADVALLPEPKARIRVNYGPSTNATDEIVMPLHIDGTDVHLGDFSGWTFVRKEWVTDDDSQQDKDELAAVMDGGQLPLSEPSALTARQKAVLRLKGRSSRLTTTEEGS